jgi:sec-independent protein translocase protein TatA
VLSSIGPLEIGILLVIVLLIFGPKKLPELGSSLGRGIRDFGRGIKGEEEPTAPQVKSEDTTVPRP